MSRKMKFFFLIALFFGLSVSAQETLIKGTITSKSDGEPILGASIVIKGTKKGTNSDFDGNYQIKVKPGEIIEISYLGFKTKGIPYLNQARIDVQLEEDTVQLEEIIVVGYGTQKKSHLTGAISKVKGAKLQEVAVSRVDDALVGQVSGVNIQSGGEATVGEAPIIRIRGTGSISGSSDPAVVVDGVVLDTDFLTNLDMSDVESFEVLKDAASAAIYGSRGANGVILITTKSGKAGKTKFSLSTTTGYKQARISDAYNFTLAGHAAKEIAYQEQLLINSGLPLPDDRSTLLSADTQAKLALGTDRNWNEVIFDPGLINTYNFSARGGNSTTKFNFSLGYTNDEGVLIKDEFSRYTLRLKLRTKLTKKLSLGVNISPSFSERERLDVDPRSILDQPVWLPVYHNENTIQRILEVDPNSTLQLGDIAQQKDFGFSGSASAFQNPFIQILGRNRNDEKFKFLGSTYADYRFSKAFKFRTSLSADFSNTKDFRFRGIDASNNGSTPSGTIITESSLNAKHYVIDNLLTFSKTVKKHEINAVAGTSKEYWHWDLNLGSGTQFVNDQVQTLTAAPLIQEIRSQRYERAMLSYLGRVNYAYDDKYLVSLSLRSDGFSVFGEDNKYGYFPAASVGWTISKEKFLKESKLINFLKFRASYGVTGNPDLRLRTGDVRFREIRSTYPSLSLIGADSYAVDNAATPIFTNLNIANPGLRWEQSVEINPAVDFGFFGNKISGSIDYYQRTSNDLLLFNPVSAVTGFNQAIDNLGKVRNSGFEIEVKTRNLTKRNFNWSTNIIATRNKNELLDFADADGQITIANQGNGFEAEYINSVGNPISSFYGYVVDREIDLQYIGNPFSRVGRRPASVYVKDLNGDGVIDDDDKTILGNPYPDLIWSVTNEFKIGNNFSFSFMFQGSHGAEIRNNADIRIFGYSAERGTSGLLPNIPIKPSSNLTLADVDGVSDERVHIKDKTQTDAMVQNASYVALRNINLGYNLGEKVTKQLNISKLRLFATAQNLFYFTASNYTGFNPESIINNVSTIYGEQRGGFPLSRTLTFGLNVEF